MIDDNIKIFIHVVPIGAWKEVFVSTLNKIKKSGLFSCSEIYVFLNHELTKYGDLINYLEKYKTVRCVHLVSAVQEDFEIPSLHHLKIITDADSAAQKILYLHLKGISREPDIRQIDWRNFMEWGCIENWKRCVEMLNFGFDTVGVNLQEHPARHYSGNIWWATSAHIKKLSLLSYPHLINFKQQVPLTSNLDAELLERFKGYRYDAEFWVCSTPSRNGELASSPSRSVLGWHYGNYYPVEEYCKI